MWNIVSCGLSVTFAEARHNLIPNLLSCEHLNCAAVGRARAQRRHRLRSGIQFPSTISLPRYIFIPQVNSYSPGCSGKTSTDTVWFCGRCARLPKDGSTTSSPQVDASRRVKFNLTGCPALTVIEAGW